MKSIFTILLLAITSTAFSQSDSFITLKKKFHHADNVTSVKVGGFMLKTILWMVEESDSDLADGFGTVKSVRVINIPQREFKERNVSANGFKKILAEDKFEEMASTFDHGERLTIYLQNRGKKPDLYFLLVENNSEVTAIEIRGELHPDKIIEDHKQKETTKI